jgi:hypothetical protein
MPGKSNAVTRDEHELANGPGQQDPIAERLAELKKNVVGPWTELLAQIPKATDPSKIALVRDTTYANQFERKAGYDAFAAYLSADPALGPYLKAAQDADRAVGADRLPFAQVVDAVVQLASGDALKAAHVEDGGVERRAHGQCLAAYVKLSAPGRKYVKKQPFVEGITSVDVKKLLKGESPLVPLEAAPKTPAADGGPGDD